MNETMNVTNQTPIEIALGIDEKGMTTARKLYEFLELNPSNYSKWLKRNITENEFAVMGEDFTRTKRRVKEEANLQMITSLQPTSPKSSQ